jgi:hypothetical protein
MPIFHLDTYLTQGVSYETRARQAIKIEKIGTNADDPATGAYLFIDNKATGPIIQDIAPLHKLTTRNLDLLDLGNLFYVIPPKTKFEVRGQTGKKIRVKGKLAMLAPGEPVPNDWLARFEVQHKRFYTYWYKYLDWSAGKTFAAEEEALVGELTPLTPEVYTFGGLAEAKIVGYTPAEGEIGIRFAIDTAWLDELLEAPKVGGIDILSMPYPPTETTNLNPFSLEAFPIQVLGDHTFKVFARNNKGTAITIPAAAGNGVYFLAVAEYEKRG